ncbi:MAG: hypothetical protein ACHREM_08445 [Polyangiales bacterium]
MARLVFARWREREIERGQLARWQRVVADASALGFVPPTGLDTFLSVARDEPWGRVAIECHGALDAAGEAHLKPRLVQRGEAIPALEYFVLTASTEIELPKMSVLRRDRVWQPRGLARELGFAFARRYRVDTEGSRRADVVAALSPIAAQLVAAPIHLLRVDERRNRKTLERTFTLSLAVELYRMDDDFNLAAMLEIVRRFVTASQEH